MPLKQGIKRFMFRVKTYKPCYLACKYQNLRSAMSSIAATIMSKVGKTAVISESTAIIITLFICITAVSIVAIIYKCDVEIDYKNGKLFVKQK